VGSPTGSGALTAAIGSVVQWSFISLVMLIFGLVSNRPFRSTVVRSAVCDPSHTGRATLMVGAIVLLRTLVALAALIWWRGLGADAVAVFLAVRTAQAGVDWARTPPQRG
jgi:hypothetical protein